MKVLEISASGRRHDSTSRMLTAELIAALESHYDTIAVARRDLADNVPFVNDAWIAANFTPEETRNTEQRDTLAYSDALVSELRDADVVVMGVPVYNFSIPAVYRSFAVTVSLFRYSCM